VVRSGDCSDSSDWRRLLQLLVLPSFAPTESWELYRSALRPPLYIVRNLTWDRQCDLKKFPSWYHRTQR
jgi:hypothetical protein